MSISDRGRVVVFCLAMGGLLALGPAYAEDGESGEVAVVNEDQPVLDEITVTATKRDEVEAQDVGLSLSALDQETLERGGVDSFSELATSVAGLAFGERGPGQNLVVLRGVNSSTTQFNTDEPESKETVGIYLDESPVSLNGYHPDLRLFDMERVEVLRGPQGTLFGSGSLSGTIRYISNAPDPAAPDARFSTTFSSTDHGGPSYEIDGMANVPLVKDRAALRFTGYGRFRDGFVDNVAPRVDPRHPLFGQTGPLSLDEFDNVNSDDTWGGRLQLFLQGEGRWRGTLRIYHQEGETGGYPTTDTFAPDQPIPGNNPADAELGELEQSRLVPERGKDELTLYNADLRFDLGAAELVSVTSYMERDLDQNFESTDIMPFLSFLGVVPFDISFTDPIYQGLNNTTEVEDFVQELRLVSHKPGRLRWLVGVFFNDQSKTFNQNAPTPGLDDLIGIPIGDNVFISSQSFDDRQWAVFGELSFDFSERWRAILGIRGFDFEQEMSFDSIGGLFSAGLDVTNRLEEGGVNPRLSLEYRPAGGGLLYATAARGFRLGGTNDPIPPICGLGTSGEAFESDSLWNYEIGFKGEWKRRVRLAGAAYFIDWQDVPVADSRRCGFGVTLNAGTVEVSGLESELTVAVTSHFDVVVSFSFTDAEFAGDFFSEDGSIVIPDGTETPLVPEWTFGARATYFFPIHTGSFQGAGFLNASWSYQGSRWNHANTLNRFEMEAYDIANLALGIEGDRWRLTLFGKNVFDERAVIFKDTIFLLHNRDTINRPRTVGLSLSVDF